MEITRRGGAVSPPENQAGIQSHPYPAARGTGGWEPAMAGQTLGTAAEPQPVNTRAECNPAPTAGGEVQEPKSSKIQKFKVRVPGFEVWNS